MLCLSGVVFPVASRGGESEKHRLENTVYTIYVTCSCVLLENQGNGICNAHEFSRPPKTVTVIP